MITGGVTLARSDIVTAFVCALIIRAPFGRIYRRRSYGHHREVLA